MAAVAGTGFEACAGALEAGAEDGIAAGGLPCTGASVFEHAAMASDAIRGAARNLFTGHLPRLFR